MLSSLRKNASNYDQDYQCATCGKPMLSASGPCRFCGGTGASVGANSTPANPMATELPSPQRPKAPRFIMERWGGVLTTLLTGSSAAGLVFSLILLVQFKLFEFFVLFGLGLLLGAAGFLCAEIRKLVEEAVSPQSSTRIKFFD